MTINAVRTSGYWVINCNAAVRSTITKCVRCKILRGKFLTCLSLRAVHIEVTHSMTTDSFIMWLRRLIGCMGYVRVIRTNNETNFVGASAELIESFQEMDHVKIGEFFQQHGGEWIGWKRNPPLASNVGDVWEHQIRTARIFSIHC